MLGFCHAGFAVMISSTPRARGSRSNHLRHRGDGGYCRHRGLSTKSASSTKVPGCREQSRQPAWSGVLPHSIASSPSASTVNRTAPVLFLGQGGDHHHPGANIRDGGQMQHRRVEQAEAAGGPSAPDRLGIACAVNAILRVPQIQRHVTQGIPNAARHFFRQVRITFAHLRRRGPVGPGDLPAYGLGSRPIEALATDRNLVRVGAPVRQYEVELSAADIDHNRTLSEVVAKGDDWWRPWDDLRTRPSVADVILSVGGAAFALTFMNTRRLLRFSCLQQVNRVDESRSWPNLAILARRTLPRKRSTKTS